VSALRDAEPDQKELATGPALSPVDALAEALAETPAQVAAERRLIALRLAEARERVANR
jgi:hypothetical protein